MKIDTVEIGCFGPFKHLEPMRIGNLATIIGKNDAGKSYVLKAISIFLETKKMTLARIQH